MESSLTNLEAYIDLYNKGLRLDQIKPLKNQTYKLFRASKKDIRIVHRKHTYSGINDTFKKIRNFTKFNEYFYMIPVTTVKGTIVGFILRGVLRSDYNTISRQFSNSEKQLPLMFGFDESFQTFDERSEKYGSALPVIVCEGSKDCLMLKRIYPYVVANNTSSMGLNSLVLRNITKKFLLAYDNDQAGKEGMEKDRKILRNAGAYVSELVLDEGFKDCSDYLGHKDKFLKLKEQVVRKLKMLQKIEG